jgi:hypothetical protein
MSANRIFAEAMDDDDDDSRDDVAEDAEPEAPAVKWEDTPQCKMGKLQRDANRELDPDKKSRILRMVDKLRAEAELAGPDEILEEEQAERIAYIRPIRDSLLHWAEEQDEVFDYVELTCYQDGSACLDLHIRNRAEDGLKVRLNITLAD